jgi:hypothetical protein
MSKALKIKTLREEIKVMKRKLALFLALVMIMSLIPANVFAASTNSIDKVPKVADDYDAWLDNPGDAPVLRIEEKYENEFNSASGSVQIFKLKLTNAEWDSSSAALMAANDAANGAATTGISYTKRSDSVMEVRFEGIDNPSDDTYMQIPLVVEVTDAGDVKVEVDSMDSKVSDGTKTFAIAADGDTKTTIEDTDSFGDTYELETIEIEELKIGTLEDTQGIVLQLPKNFKWHSDSEAGNIEYSGAFDSVSGETIDVDPTNDRRLNITTADLGANNSTRGALYISGLKIVAESKAAFGDVEVKIYGDDDLGNDDVTTETFVVAKYVNYEVVVEADGDATELYAGDYEGDRADEQEAQLLVIEEEIASSWLTERRTRIEFPSWVKILAVDVDDVDNLSVANADFDEYEGEEGNAENYVELSGEDKAALTDTTSLELIFFLSIEADQTGDIVATVSGTSLEDDVEVVVAKAVAPVEVTTTVEDVRVGLQDQAIGSITITEADAEVMTEGEWLVVALDEDYFDFADTPDVEVTKGDLEIDEDDIDVVNNVLIIPIKSESSEAATIEITNITADLDRAVPEGDFNVEVGGFAIVKNAETGSFDLDEGAFTTDYVAKEVIARVITPADDNTQAGQTVAFTIDSMEYMVGDAAMTADVAPFIDANNRTMLPLRAFANALGVTNENIVWNGTERSVTIFKGDAVVKVVIDQMSFMKNGVSVPMDTKAVIKDGRTFLPVRALGQAMGAQIGWDSATRTVTID